MYVMSSLPRHQQGMAGGIFNVVIRLSNTAVMGITTAVFSSVELTPAGVADPTLPYIRTFQTCVAFAGVGLLLSPFTKLGTQGNAPPPSEDPITSDLDKAEVTDDSGRTMAENEKK